MFSDHPVTFKIADEEGSYIYAEDIVSLKESEGSSRIGLVIRSGSNCDSSDDEEFDDDYEDEDKVKDGELLVCWYPSGEEEVISESKVGGFHIVLFIPHMNEIFSEANL